MAFAALVTPCINPKISHPAFAVKTTRDDEFSLYFSLIRENFMPEFGNAALNPSPLQLGTNTKRNQDGEIGIFGAEKYFSGGMDRVSKPAIPKEVEAQTKPRSITRSTCSESSGNSQSTLLRDRQKLPPSPSKQSHVRGKGFLGVLGCSCSDKKAVDIEREPIGDSNSSNSKSNGSSGYKVEMGCRNINIKEPPLTNSNPMPPRKMTGTSDFFSSILLRDELGLNRRKSLVMLSSKREEDLGSESSSDLFEIEGLTMNPQSLFGGESTCYEPSEASIEWSVATASVANFSSDFNADDRRSTRGNVGKKQHRPGILMGCVSEKAVDAANVGLERRGSAEGHRRLQFTV